MCQLKHRFSSFGAALLIVVLGGSKAKSDPLYTVTGIAPLPGTSQSIATAINNNGQVVGTSYNSVTGNSNTYGGAYPNAGAYDPGAKNIVSSGGQTTEISTAGGNAPNSINDSGRIVYGDNWVNNSGYTVSSGGFMYNPDGSLKTTLAYYDQQQNAQLLENSVHINSSGLVVGTLNVNGGPAVYVPTGSTWSEALLLHANATLAFGGTIYTGFGIGNGPAISINDRGELLMNAGIRTSVLDQTGQLTNLANLPGGANLIGVAINDSGQVVGSRVAVGLDGLPTRDSSGNYDYLKAMLYSNGQVFDLNSLIPAGSGWDLTRATGINNLGQIVGQGTYDGQEMGFVLTPVGSEVPEPSTLAFAGLAIGAFFGRMMIRRCHQRSEH